MSELLLDEEVIEPVLEQMCRIRVAQTVRAEVLLEPDGVAVLGEPLGDRHRSHPCAALGGPEGELVGVVEGPDLGDPLVDGLGGPFHGGQDRAAPRRSAGEGFAVAHRQRPVAAELGGRGVGGPVDGVEHRGLPAA